MSMTLAEDRGEGWDVLVAWDKSWCGTLLDEEGPQTLDPEFGHPVKTDVEYSFQPLLGGPKGLQNHHAGSSGCSVGVQGARAGGPATANGGGCSAAVAVAGSSPGAGRGSVVSATRAVMGSPAGRGGNAAGGGGRSVDAPPASASPSSFALSPTPHQGTLDPGTAAICGFAAPVLHWRPPSYQGIHSTGRSHISHCWYEGPSTSSITALDRTKHGKPIPVTVSSAVNISGSGSGSGGNSNNGMPKPDGGGSSAGSGCSLDSGGGWGTNGELPPGSVIVMAPVHSTSYHHILQSGFPHHAIPMTPPKPSGGLKAALCKQAQPYVLDVHQAKLPATPYLGGYLGLAGANGGGSGGPMVEEATAMAASSPDVTVRGRVRVF